MWDFFFFFPRLIIVKKLSWNNNRGHWAAHAECERQSWLPSRDQVSLKARGRKEGLFYERRGEKQTHTHTLPLFSHFSLSFLFTCMNICRCLAREKGRKVRASFSCRRYSYRTPSMFSVLPFYLESLHYTHMHVIKLDTILSIAQFVIWLKWEFKRSHLQPQKMCIY